MHHFSPESYLKLDESFNDLVSDKSNLMQFQKRYNQTDNEDVKYNTNFFQYPSDSEYENRDI